MSTMRESDPRRLFGKQMRYHYANNALHGLGVYDQIASPHPLVGTPAL